MAPHELHLGWFVLPSPLAVTMVTTGPSTTFARLTPRQARAVLLGLLGMGLFCVAVTLSPIASTQVGKARPGAGDLALYRAEVERIHAGQGYYAAAHAELTARGYPTRSVFNWRLPTLGWCLGHLPSLDAGKVLLGLLALALMVVSFEVLAREQGHGLGRPIACVLLLSGPLMPCVLGDLVVAHELWAGVLIALSIGVYGLERPCVGAALGLAALFIRELALPYCVLALGLAWWHGRHREMAVWLVGLVLWAAYLAIHAWQVQPWIPADARTHSTSWIQFGGAAFVLATAQMNAYLLLLPQWVTALWFVAALVGMAAWSSPLGERTGLTLCLFVVAFSVVGQDFNQYWGSMFAPLFCFGAVQFPAALGDLWRAARIPGLWTSRSAKLNDGSLELGRSLIDN